MNMRLLIKNLASAERIRATRLRLTQILLAAFIFTALHSAVHKQFDHVHDASCSIYVLEELFFASDLPTPIEIELLFIPFLFIAFSPSFYLYLPTGRYAIRAPPRS